MRSGTITRLAQNRRTFLPPRRTAVGSFWSFRQEVNDEVAVVRGHAVAEPDRPMVCQLTMLRRRPRKKMKSDFLPESDTAMSKVSVR